MTCASLVCFCADDGDPERNVGTSVVLTLNVHYYRFSTGLYEIMNNSNYNSHQHAKPFGWLKMF
jgi:hypothetical protein